MDNTKDTMDFDEKFYLETYPELKGIGIKPIEHYLLHGKNEGRFKNLEDKQKALNKEKALDQEAIDIDFDEEFYLETYPELKGIGIKPIEHYLLHGKNEGRFKNLEDKQEFLNKEKIFEGLTEDEILEYNIITKADINWSYYDLDNSHQVLGNDYVYNYIKNWKQHKPLIRNFFDTNYYLDKYQDIDELKKNPLVHYILAGQTEGRKAIFDTSNIIKGKVEFDENKETIVFVSHESSATGAPLLGYNIANKLISKYNVVHIIAEKSNIHDAFLKNCSLMICDLDNNHYKNSYIFLKNLIKQREIKSVICNSIVTSEILSAAHALNIPILLLIHEFTEYTKPETRTMQAVFRADGVIVPAKIIQDSILKEFNKHTWIQNTPTNIYISPQGKLPYIPEDYGANDSAKELCKKLNIDSQEDAKIIVGSGWVHIRKGVDLFIATARQIKKNYRGKCKFVWVGGGFEPDNDLAYSVWLNREIKYSELDDDFIFLEHQKNLDTIFSISDVFCLTSRMDPFPNVVIDALSHDLHIACFDNATGSSEFLQKHDASCTIAKYVDTTELANGVIDYLTSKKDKVGVNKNIVKSNLNFDIYVDELDKIMQNSIQSKKKSQNILDFLIKSGEFDSEYFGGDDNIEKHCRTYVETSLKGIHFKNPKAGFSQLQWLNKHPKQTNIVPLYEAIKKSNMSTHNTQNVPYDFDQEIEFFYAVHLHLFYIDLAQEFVSYFKELPGKFDILITIIDKEDAEEIKSIFLECGANNIKVFIVENIGRDSGSLYFALKEEIFTNRYEVIGHFHTKKSFDIQNGIGETWRKFLTETLLGNKEVSKSVLGIFSDPNIGLIFADDFNVVDIGKNREYLDDLCNMIDKPQIQETAIFPVGNMFWARVDAIKELFMLDAKIVLQKEPLAYDGSFVHAIERVTSSLVESNGYNFKTVYKKDCRRYDSW